MAGWWYRASREEKLAQIDAGIELGLTAAQIAMNCGCHLDQTPTVNTGAATLRSFAYYHGRNFPKGSEEHKRKHFRNSGTIKTLDGEFQSKRQKRIADAKQAYLSGEPVDIWAVE